MFYCRYPVSLKIVLEKTEKDVPYLMFQVYMGYHEFVDPTSHQDEGRENLVPLMKRMGHMHTSRKSTLCHISNQGVKRVLVYPPSVYRTKR